MKSTTSELRSPNLLWMLACVATFVGLSSWATAQDTKSAFLFPVTLPIDDLSERQAKAAIKDAATQATEKQRATVILRFGDSQSGVASDSGDGSALEGRGTSFERALGLARFLSSEDAKQVKAIAFVAGKVEGHAVLPVLACDQIVVTPQGSLGNAGIDEKSVDKAMVLFYESTADRRRTIPMNVVKAMLDSSLELSRVNKVNGGGDLFLAGEELAKARDEGDFWKEDVLCKPGQLASFTGSELRKYRWATHEVSDEAELPSTLGLESVRGIENAVDEQPNAVLGEVVGPVNARRMRRVTHGLSDAVNQRGCNQIVMVLDTAGGDLDESARVAGYLADTATEGIRTAAFIDSRALGDAALVALSARKVYAAPGSIIGGPGDGIFSASDVEELDESIDHISRVTGRSASLVRALLDPQHHVFRYKDTRQGLVGYFSAEEIASKDNPERWTQEQQVETAEGLTAEQALELGLIDGIEVDLRTACRTIGLDATPRGIEERRIVRFVETLARQIWVPRLLLFMGFFMLSVEMGAPGIGVPGFVSLLSFLLFFWIQAAGGTAEWLEIFLFAGGVACLFAELFLFPGFGIFGIGGFLMLITSIVLVSQTFVFPQNAYQYEELTGSLVGVLAAIGGVVGGGITLRYMMPQLPFFRHMMMTEDDAQRAARTQQEALVNWNHLVGRIGKTTTPLVPAGKARFEDEVVAVVSNGPMVEADKPIVVMEVQGNRVIVEERSLEG